MTKLTKNEKILRKASKKWENFLAEGAFKKTLKEFDEDDAYHFDVDKHSEEDYTAAGNFKMGDVVKVMNRGNKYDEPEELRCRVGTVTGMDGRDLTLKFDNGEVATIKYFNAARDESGLWSSKGLFNCPEEQVSEVDLSKQEDDEFQYNQAQARGGPREGDDVKIIGGALTGAEGEVMELTTTPQGSPAVVVYLRKDADMEVYGKAGDEVIVQPKFVEVDRGIQAGLSEARMGEYGKMDAEQGLPPTKIGRGNEEYMAAYNAVLQARGEEPLDIQKPDQAYLDALRSGQLEEASAGDDLAAVSNAVAMLGQLKKDIDKGFASTITAAMLELNKIQNYLEKEQGGQLQENEKKNLKEEITKRVTKILSEGLTPKQVLKEMRRFASPVGPDAIQKAKREKEEEYRKAREKKGLREEVIEDFAIELEDGVTFADVEEAGLVTPGVDSVIDNGDGYAQVYAEPGAMAKMAKTLEAMTGVMVSPESHGAVDEEMSKKDFVKMVRDKGKVPNLKGDMGPISGLEGPFQYRSGAVLYYDPKAGKYYDRGRDMYLDDQEAAELTMEDRTTTSSDPEFDQVQDIAADMLELSARSRIPVSLESVKSALEKQAFDAVIDKGMLIVDNKYVIADKKSLPGSAQKISFTGYGIDYLSNLQGEQQDLPLE